MRRGEPVEPALLAPFAKRDVARGTGPVLQVPALNAHRNDAMWHTKLAAERCDVSGLRCAFLPQPVVDRRRFHAAGQRGMGKQEQCEAVPAA